MEQDTRTFLEQFEKQILGMINSMEKRLEDKIDVFMKQSQDAGHENTARHGDFRTDIKQVFGRIELIEKSDVALELRVKNIEDDKKAKKEDTKFRWEYLIMVGSLLVAAIALFYGG